MRLTAITCTCDRPEALALCMKYVQRQTRRPDEHLIFPGDQSMPDKILSAIDTGQITGDALIFCEDDDYIRPGWFEWCEKQLERGFDMVGQGNALYYQVRWRWWSGCWNARHASLCQTAITREMFPTLRNIITASKHPFFDVPLWAAGENKYLHLPKTPQESYVIGIKGMPGKIGYSGEHQHVKGAGTTWDHDGSKLREWIGDDAAIYEPFYQRNGGIQSLAGCAPLKLPPEDGPMPKVEVHILTHDFEDKLEWALRHYKTFASKIVVHDGGPTGYSMAHCFKYGAHRIPWDTEGCLNDMLACQLKNDCWKGTDADWVIVADCDELIYFPFGASTTLRAYERMGAVVIKPKGFEMFADFIPEGPGQIYDYVKFGGRDDKWYAKPIVFRPKAVGDNHYGIGTHDTHIALHDGRRLHVGEDWPFAEPPTYMLHFKAIGPIEHVAARYDATRARLSPLNVKCNWGNVHDLGIDHAIKKRKIIMDTLQQVIP